MFTNIVGFVVGSVFLFTIGSEAWSQTPDPAKWQELIKKAQGERSLALVGPPSAGLRAELLGAFSRRYGIQVDYLSLNGAETMVRVDTEAKAGHVVIDAVIGGTGSCWMMAARGQIESVNGKLIDADVVKPGAWRGGSLRFVDAGPVPPGTPDDFRCGFQSAEWVMTDLFVNSTIVKPGEITSWKDLLKPEYKGRIASNDPRHTGPITTTVMYLAEQFGHQYLKDLFVGQAPRLTTNHRQLAEWVARGEYPIGLSLVQFAVEPLRREGLPIERIFPADGPGAVTGGFSVMAMIKNSQHPNAAQLFVNWYASQEAQTIYEKQMMETSLRTDVTGTEVPEYIRPKPDVTYVDAYRWEFDSKFRAPALETLKELGR
jgi:ABC-type Fe3+ transport system substrate-binding protein